MPIYQFRCKQDHEFERLLPVDQRDDIEECPTCGAPVQRLLGNFTAIAKWPGRTSPKAMGSANDFIPRSPKEWKQGVGRNHGK